jgi:HD-GYP domain-containing protein (c-di-GMP phosphodiesterase class II)
VAELKPNGASSEGVGETATLAADPTTGQKPVCRVYYHSDDVAALLCVLGLSWEILPLPKRLEPDDAGGSIIVGDSPEIFMDGLREAIEQDRTRLIYVTDEDATLPQEAGGVPIFAFLSAPIKAPVLKSLVIAAFENLDLSRRQAALERQLERARNEVDLLNEIGIALSRQRGRQPLLQLILQKSREITHSDAGALYLVEEDDRGEKCLHFEVTQNDSVPFLLHESVLAIDSSSVAGYVASSGQEIHLEDVYRIPRSFPFHFNRKFDQESGYRTKSMLAVPMTNPQGEITGVLQLINCKRDPALRVNATSEEAVIPFPVECRALLRSLASQAAVAIENNRLYESIETLFEGFVRASVIAIEARDPATSGHSFRVADLTLRLADVVDRDDSPAFRDVHFSRTEMKEIRYASLLHDFGKVGVREEVLVKAKKLYPDQLELLKQRFAFARKTLELEQSERRLAYVLEKGREDFLARREEFDRELEERLRELDEFLHFVVRCNEPTVLREGNFERLTELAARQFVDGSGQKRPLLTSREVKLLSISKGTLDDQERRQIESHVTHTLNFLRQIPWTKEIKNIPSIASAHHEKLNRTGYPSQLSAKEIPFQSKMMTIADIYDALAATDRPYKKAVPWNKALDILSDEAKKGLVDGELLGLFRAAEVFRLTASANQTKG